MRKNLSKQELDGLEYREIYTLERIRNFNRTSKIWTKESNWDEFVDKNYTDN